MTSGNPADGGPDPTYMKGQMLGENGWCIVMYRGKVASAV